MIYRYAAKANTKMLQNAMKKILLEGLQKDLGADFSAINVNHEDYGQVIHYIPLEKLGDILWYGKSKIEFVKDLGFHSLNGFTVFLGTACGDREEPVIFAIYLDHHKNLRIYVPKYGNIYNRYTKKAFGAERYYANGCHLWRNRMPDLFEIECNEDNEIISHSPIYRFWIKHLQDNIDLRIILADVASKICLEGKYPQLIDRQLIRKDRDIYYMGKTLAA